MAVVFGPTLMSCKRCIAVAQWRWRQTFSDTHFWVAKLFYFDWTLPRKSPVKELNPEKAEEGKHVTWMAKYREKKYRFGKKTQYCVWVSLRCLCFIFRLFFSRFDAVEMWAWSALTPINFSDCVTTFQGMFKLYTVLQARHLTLIYISTHSTSIFTSKSWWTVDENELDHGLLGDILKSLPVALTIKSLSNAYSKISDEFCIQLLLC